MNSIDSNTATCIPLLPTAFELSVLAVIAACGSEVSSKISDIIRDILYFVICTFCCDHTAAPWAWLGDDAKWKVEVEAGWDGGDTEICAQ